MWVWTKDSAFESRSFFMDTFDLFMRYFNCKISIVNAVQMIIFDGDIIRQLLSQFNYNSVLLNIGKSMRKKLF